MKELQLIQTKLKAPKDNYNAFGKYKYRSAESILEAVKPLLAEQGCTLTLTDDIAMVGDRIYIVATATITNSKGDAVQTKAYAREEETKKGMDASQITGTASSYARKYALNGLFCIDDTKDADALNTSDDYTAKPVDVKKAIKEAEDCKTRDELVKVWEKYATLQGDNRFKSAVADMGTKLKQAS